MEKKKLRRRCLHCGEIGTVGVNINWWSCPFDVDMNDDDTPCWHCNDCDYTCAMEV